ncbi:MAG: extracellular matrix/biofilm biosynthesis regulator RemA family protein [Chloroflexia bacterium]
MPVELLHIGFGNMVVARRVVAVLAPDSLPVRRLIREARERGALLDASRGRKVRSALVLDNGTVVTSALHPSTIARRLGAEEGERDAGA